MNSKLFALSVIIIGIVMIVVTGFNIVTTTEVIDAGPFVINKEVNHPVQWPPIVGVILLIIGLWMFFRSKKVAQPS
jgi:hypothetical protein